MVNPAPPDEFEFDIGKTSRDHYNEHLDGLMKNRTGGKSQALDLEHIKNIAKAQSKQNKNQKRRSQAM